jgi:hypothetical protein
MPLKDALPVIDDRRYDDIVAEVRTRIARYTPEWTPVWTDLNDSDPGITLTQVFAWLAEMMIYRMGKVPELNYVKFLELLGIELRARQPAQAEIAFGVKDTHDQAVVIVRPRTQVSGASADGGPNRCRPSTATPIVTSPRPTTTTRPWRATSRSAAWPRPAPRSISASASPSSTPATGRASPAARSTWP